MNELMETEFHMYMEFALDFERQITEKYSYLDYSKSPMIVDALVVYLANIETKPIRLETFPNASIYTSITFINGLDNFEITTAFDWDDEVISRLTFIDGKLQ